MKAFTLSALSTLFAGLTLAFPVDLAKRTGHGGFSDIDITILQFALTLEHLENTFYKEAFSMFKIQDFLNAGFDEEFFINLQFIAGDESAHVDLLIAAISGAGVQPVAPCEYNFGITDVETFVTQSAILESVGTSAYLGAAPFLASKDILAVAASIMVTEALHTSLQRSSIGGIGAPDPFGTSLDANSVFSLAAQFIVSCPPENPPLPFSAFPGLKIDAQPCFGEDGGFTTTDEASGYYATIAYEDINTKATDYVTYVADSTATWEVDTATYDTNTVYEAETTAYATDTTTYETNTGYEAQTTTYEVNTATATDSTYVAPSWSSSNTTTTDVKAWETSTSTMDMNTAWESSTSTMDMKTAWETSTSTMDMNTAWTSTWTTSTTTTEAASWAPTYAPPPPYRRSNLRARTSESKAISCPAPFSGSPVVLHPDFSSSKHDFRQIVTIFVTFISGLDIISVEAQFSRDGSLTVIIPPSAQGQVYIFITIVDVSGRKLNDADVLFGPAIMEVAPKVPSIR